MKASVLVSCLEAQPSPGAPYGHRGGQEAEAGAAELRPEPLSRSLRETGRAGKQPEVWIPGAPGQLWAGAIAAAVRGWVRRWSGV